MKVGSKISDPNRRNKKNKLHFGQLKSVLLSFDFISGVILDLSQLTETIAYFSSREIC